MDEDWRIVFDSPMRGACADRALVLSAVGIPHQIVRDEAGFVIVVPAEYSGQASDELWQYDTENAPRPRAPAAVIPDFDARPGIFAYLIVVCVVGYLAARNSFSEDWLRAGRVDGELIRAGEWWRPFTALTLHSGIRHLAGNIVFGSLFGLFAGRLLGSGVAWLAIVVSAAAANVANTLLLDTAHRSIGASTAVFAALGLVAAYVWRGRLMSQERWPYRVGPIVGGVALLMFTGSGSGDGTTDVGAHLLGFVCGFGTGLLLVNVRDLLPAARLQNTSAVLAMLLLVAAWVAALTAY